MLSLAEIISAIYAIEVPQREGSKTTYNVGVIEGGTSVNTIPENAKMLCEYRSNDKECLAIMQKHFEEIFAAANTDETAVTYKLIGDRPCAGDVDESAEADLADRCRRVIKEVTGQVAVDGVASTDCNIPLSLGIPAVCISSYEGARAHTRGEYVREASLLPGLEVTIKVLADLTEVNV